MRGKKLLSNLAILGGAPAFTNEMYVGRPNIGDRQRFLERVNDLLDRRWLTNDGPYVQEFEERIADYIGVRHCVATCNGATALEIAIRALNLTGEVIVPSFTFIATAHALQWQGGTPVFCDIDPHTHGLDPRRVEEMITPRVTGIIGVHLWGRGCDVEALSEIARRHRLRLMFDAAHAFTCSHKGKMIGEFGAAEVFSFHATKFLNTFEGGAIVTNDDGLAARLRMMRNFGFAGYDKVVCVGANGKMSEISAAMGLTSLESQHAFIAVNRRNYELYRALLSGAPGISLISYDDSEKCNYQYVVLEVDESVAGIIRDELVEVLRAENVIARRYFYPGCHLMEPYRSHFPKARLALTVTERLCRCVLSLPTGTSVSEADIRMICHLIAFVVENSGEVRSKMGRVNHNIDASPSADEERAFLTAGHLC